MGPATAADRAHAPPLSLPAPSLLQVLACPPAPPPAPRYGTIRAAGTYFLDSPHGQEAVTALFGVAAFGFMVRALGLPCWWLAGGRPRRRCVFRLDMSGLAVQTRAPEAEAGIHAAGEDACLLWQETGP